MSDVRSRKYCTQCGSIRIKRRARLENYVCENCGHRMDHPPEKMCLCGSGGGPQRETPARIARIKEVHMQNPTMTQKQLIAATNETTWMVTQYWKQSKL